MAEKVYHIRGQHWVHDNEEGVRYIVRHLKVGEDEARNILRDAVAGRGVLTSHDAYLGRGEWVSNDEDGIAYLMEQKKLTKEAAQLVINQAANACKPGCSCDECKPDTTANSGPKRVRYKVRYRVRGPKSDLVAFNHDVPVVNSRCCNHPRVRCQACAAAVLLIENELDADQVQALTTDEPTASDTPAIPNDPAPETNAMPLSEACQSADRDADIASSKANSLSETATTERQHRLANEAHLAAAQAHSAAVRAHSRLDNPDTDAIYRHRAALTKHLGRAVAHAKKAELLVPADQLQADSAEASGDFGAPLEGDNSAASAVNLNEQPLPAVSYYGSQGSWPAGMALNAEAEAQEMARVGSCEYWQGLFQEREREERQPTNNIRDIVPPARAAYFGPGPVPAPGQGRQPTTNKGGEDAHLLLLSASDFGFRS